MECIILYFMMFYCIIPHFIMVVRNDGGRRMFIGRETELNRLDAHRQSGAVELVTLVGQRGVGKSALLREFRRRVLEEGKRMPDARPLVVSVRALEGSAERNLEILSGTLQWALGETVGGRFVSFEAAFDHVSKKRRTASGARRPLFLLIDNFPALASSAPDFSTALAKAMTAEKEGGPKGFTVVLAGRSAPMAGLWPKASDGLSALLQHRTGEIRLDSLDFFDARRFFPGWSTEDQFLAYAALGACPPTSRSSPTRRTSVTQRLAICSPWTAPLPSA